MIVIIDYGSGNLKSIKNVLKYLNCDSIISKDQNEIKNAQGIIFPGQGHFGQAMSRLKESNLSDSILDFIESGRPFLGICLGLQILFESSEEAPNEKGLGIFKGTCKKFNSDLLKVPQIGWNQVQVIKGNSFLQKNQYFYFVNSYYVVPEDNSIISSISKYGKTFCASIKKDNISAVQFHPEKSSQAGISFFSNWLEQC